MLDFRAAVATGSGGVSCALFHVRLPASHAQLRRTRNAASCWPRRCRRHRPPKSSPRNSSFTPRSALRWPGSSPRFKQDGDPLEFPVLLVRALLAVGGGFLGIGMTICDVGQDATGRLPRRHVLPAPRSLMVPCSSVRPTTSPCSPNFAIESTTGRAHPPCGHERGSPLLPLASPSGPRYCWPGAWLAAAGWPPSDAAVGSDLSGQVIENFPAILFARLPGRSASVVSSQVPTGTWDEITEAGGAGSRPANRLNWSCGRQRRVEHGGVENRLKL